jgi:ribosomal protein S18 acetylase RimI-like enzyme
VELQSLGFRTELALLEGSGSEVVDRGTHLVVRTPDNPTFYWGNFLLLPAAPGPGEVEGWIEEHRRELGAAHVTLGIDTTDGRDLEPLAAAGMRVDQVRTMAAGEVQPPPHPATDLVARRLSGDDDWEQLVDLTLAGEEDDPHLTREFVQRRTDSYRHLVETGQGHWWGAFVDGDLASGLGIFRAGEGLARYQSVKTHPDARGRGLCGTLVHHAGADALAGLGATTLVMCADPSYSAIRIYRSVGFRDAGLHAEATLTPARPS